MSCNKQRPNDVFLCQVVYFTMISRCCFMISQTKAPPLLTYSPVSSWKTAIRPWDGMETMTHWRRTRVREISSTDWTESAGSPSEGPPWWGVWRTYTLRTRSLRPKWWRRECSGEGKRIRWLLPRSWCSNWHAWYVGMTLSASTWRRGRFPLRSLWCRWVSIGMRQSGCEFVTSFHRMMVPHDPDRR